MTRRIPFTRYLAVLALVVFVVFWTWALFFASRDAVNRVDDTAWSERSEGYCADAATQREALADYTPIRDGGPSAIRQRADIVDEATDTLDAMLAQIEAAPPADVASQQTVSLWLDEYHTYVGNRRTYSEQLRATGENLPFYEKEVNGIPISERLATFAADNRMPSCAPPRDLDT